jgi:hypothetical protein
VDHAHVEETATVPDDGLNFKQLGQLVGNHGAWGESAGGEIAASCQAHSSRQGHEWLGSLTPKCSDRVTFAVYDRSSPLTFWHVRATDVHVIRCPLA